MKNLPAWKTVILVMAVFLAFSLTGTGEALAAWEDESGDLPGTDDSNTFLIVAGVIVVGLIVYMIVKNSGDDDAEENTEGENESPAGGGSSSSDEPETMAINVYGISSPRYDAGYSFPVDPVVYMKKDRVGVGLGFGF